MDGEPRDGQGRQHRHRLFLWRGRSTSPASASRRARAGDPRGQLTLARSRAGRRRGGANLDHALAGLHADGDRSRRRLHHLVCWRLREEGREQLLDSHWRVSNSGVHIMKNLSIRLMADTILPLIVVASLAGCTPSTPEQQFIDDAMQAIGGRSRVEAVKTLTLEGEGVNYNLGQDMKPEGSGQQFAITGYKRQIDIANGRQRIEQTRTPKFAYFQGPQPQTQVQGPRWRDRVQRQRAGPADAARGARRNRSAARPLSPPAEAAAFDDGSEDHGDKRPFGRHRAAGRHHHRRRSHGDDDDRCRGRAVVGLVKGLSSQSWRRGHDHDVRRFPGRERAAPAGAFCHQGRRFHDRRKSAPSDRRSIRTSAISPHPPRSPDRRPPAPPINVVVQPIGKGVWLLAGGSHHSVP